MGDSQKGITVMLYHLFGDNSDTVAAYQGAMGKTISALALDPDEGDGGALIMRFTDGTGIKVWDDGRSCYEERYMHTDDDLPAFVGATLVEMELREAPDLEDECGCPHEVQFVLVNTSLGTFTMETHNIHNGYYGGFVIRVEQLDIAD